MVTLYFVRPFCFNPNVRIEIILGGLLFLVNVIEVVCPRFETVHYGLIMETA